MTEKTQPLRLTDTALRDGSQSLLATRVRLEDMLPVAEMMDNVGFWSLEVWGGATFDSCLRFLNEDPWQRLRTFKKYMPKTPLQMLLRGQVVVGYRHYADDVVRRFIGKARENGIGVFRIFDAFNDLRNMETAMRAAKQEGGHVQACFCYTLSPVHSNDAFVALGQEMAQMGADSICIKDMGGLISPYDAYELTRKLKAKLDIPVQLHTHYTSGMASAAGLKAAEAGLDVLDTAMSPMALSTSQPATEPMVAMLQGRERDTGLDLALLSDISKKLTEMRKKYAVFETGLFGVDTNVLLYQVPGGMISNLISQLREQNALDKLSEVLQEVPRVRKDLGYPPLVTPSSQICGTQAVLNVVLGERFKMAPKEVTAICKGLYGRTPAPINPEIRKKVIGDEQPIECRPADLLEPEMEKAAKELGALAACEEDVLSYVLFPQVALPFFKRRARTDELSQETVAVLAAALAQTEAGARA
ncbi:MAG: pyruvate carboxylase subunit B [Candidatus Methylomirabilota bacterium]